MSTEATATYPIFYASEYTSIWGDEISYVENGYIAVDKSGQVSDMLIDDNRIGRFKNHVVQIGEDYLLLTDVLYLDALCERP